MNKKEWKRRAKEYDKTAANMYDDFQKTLLENYVLREANKKLIEKYLQTHESCMRAIEYSYELFIDLWNAQKRIKELEKEQ